MLFGDNEQKKKQKEQRSREKEWKGKLTGAGMEKGAAGELAKIITEACLLYTSDAADEL
mgnify:CR=1 FL=1